VTRREQRPWLAWPALRWAVPATVVLATAALLYVVARPTALPPQKTTELARAVEAPVGGGGGGGRGAIAPRPAASAPAAATAAPGESASPGGSPQRAADARAKRPSAQAAPPGLAAESRIVPKPEVAQNQAAPAAAGAVGGVAVPPAQALVAAPPPTAADRAQKAMADAARLEARAVVPSPAGVSTRVAAGRGVQEPARLSESVVIGSPVVVASPDGSTRWRVESRDRISRSRDGGTTWAAQAVRTSTDVLAGSAPSTDVCWFVGRAGLVLLTSDAERWDVRPFPERADLVAIEARDARHATVTTLDGHRFVTEDGGATWVRQ
jgi:hypothetical protein